MNNSYDPFTVGSVATALTVYGIETEKITVEYNGTTEELQQLLPFTVLKPTNKLETLMLF